MKYKNDLIQYEMPTAIDRIPPYRPIRLPISPDFLIKSTKFTIATMLDFIGLYRLVGNRMHTDLRIASRGNSSVKVTLSMLPVQREST